MRFTPHQIILVTPESRAGVMIDVVLNKRNAIACLQLPERVQQQSITGKIINNGVAQTDTFGRGLFDMSHVEIKAAAV